METVRTDSAPDMMGIEDLVKESGWGRTVTYREARANRLPLPVYRVGRRMFVSRRAYEALVNATADPRMEAEADRKGDAA